MIIIFALFILLKIEKKEVAKSLADPHQFKFRTTSQTNTLLSEKKKRSIAPDFMHLVLPEICILRRDICSK